MGWSGDGPYRIYSDKNMSWRPGRIFIPGLDFTGLIGAAGVAVGASTGACVTQEISTLGMVAPMMDTAGDVLDHMLTLPGDVDLKKDIRFRVHWTSGSADTADTIAWKVFYAPIVPDTTTIIEGATALTTVVASDTVLGAYVYQATAYGLVSGGTIAQNVEVLSLQVEMDAFAAGLAEDKFLLGLEIVYSPKRMRGPDGMAINAQLPTAGALSSQY